MPVSMSETKQLVRQWLLDDPAINEATGGKVYGVHLSSSDAQTVLRDKPIVVFEFVAGTARYNRELHTPVVEVYVYSKDSADDVARVYDLVYLRLQAERIQIAGIGPCGTAVESERPTDGWNEAVAAWFSRARWNLSVIAGPE